MFDREDAGIEDILRPSELIGLDWIAVYIAIRGRYTPVSLKVPPTHRPTGRATGQAAGRWRGRWAAAGGSVEGALNGHVHTVRIAVMGGLGAIIT